MIRALAMVVVLALSAPALAQDLPRLSSRGHQLVDGAVGGLWSNERQPGAWNRAPQFVFYVQPSWVYFVRDRIGLGAYVNYRLSQDGFQVGTLDSSGLRTSILRPPRTHTFSAGFVATFELLAHGRLGLYARPYVGFASSWTHRWRREPLFEQGIGAVDYQAVRVRRLGPEAGVHIPLVYQLSRHLGIGFGPDFSWVETRDERVLRFAVSTWLARVF